MRKMKMKTAAAELRAQSPGCSFHAKRKAVTQGPVRTIPSKMGHTQNKRGGYENEIGHDRERE